MALGGSRRRRRRRRNWDDSIFRAGRLAQEWWCSCWIKAEEHRLDFLASAAGQAQIKADTYSALKRHVQGLDADTSVGRVVLPNTHRGSRRRMATAYQDGNCLVHHYGSPDIFFTATANANAPEVLRHLKEGQKPTDRPDLVAIVFQQHVDKLMEELKTKYGEYAAKFGVLEFQKRGLPHVHILLWLSGDDRITSAEGIDEIVAAIIPNENLKLRDIIVKQMVHDCGPRCRDATGKCTKRFPKPHCEESTYQTVDPTTGEENVEAVPRRPKDNDWTNGERVVTSANIVAYPPADVLRHEWHMNAEVCAGSNSVQYLTKYFTKTGSLDSAMIKQKTTEISAAEAKARITGAIAAATKHDSDKAQQSTKPDDVIDEIAAHRDSRVVGAPSAVMALRSYPELYIDPPVQSLAVHLPGEEQVFYASAKKGAMQRAVTKHSEEYTTLTAYYFAANEGDISSAGAPAQCKVGVASFVSHRSV